MKNSSFILPPSSLVSERSLEDAIEAALLQHNQNSSHGEETTGVREPTPGYGDVASRGYYKRQREEYDRALCLVPRDVADFRFLRSNGLS